MSRLWDAERGRFLARDLHAGRLSTAARSARSRRCSIPTCRRASRARWPTRSPRRTSARPPGLGVASYDLLADDFDARRYWRGPVWANLNWLLARGLRQHGLDADADELDAATLRLVAGAGMREYFDPHTGEGRGADDFSWTAAVLVDLVRSRAGYRRREARRSAASSASSRSEAGTSTGSGDTACS